MNILLYIIISSFLISVLSLFGVVTLVLKKNLLSKYLLALVALSAGTMLGGAFLHLLPEAGEYFVNGEELHIALLAFIVFLFVEKALHWHHCHNEDCSKHVFGYTMLVGDSLHNFIDGLLIAGAFVTDIRLGIATSFAIALHELPQEIGDFGVLIHSGIAIKKALFLNFITALTAMLGAVVGFFATTSIEGLTSYLVPFAAGGFIYIAASDLLPEIKHEEDSVRSIVSILFFFIGLLTMYLLKFTGI